MNVSFKKKVEDKYATGVSKELQTLKESLSIIESLPLEDEQKKELIAKEYEKYTHVSKLIQDAVHVDSMISSSTKFLFSWIHELEKVKANNIFYSNAPEVFSFIEKVTRVYETNSAVINKVCPNFNNSKKRIFECLNNTQSNLYDVQSNKAIYYKDIYSLADAAAIVVSIHHAILNNEEAYNHIYLNMKHDSESIKDAKDNIVDDLSIKDNTDKAA